MSVDPAPAGAELTKGTEIRRDDLTGAAIRELLAEHLADMHRITPSGSVRALDLDALRAPQVTLWTLWRGNELFGCGALKELDAAHAEIKSMRTAVARRGEGVGRAMLAHLVAEARCRGYTRLSLETGASAAFEPARRLYEAHGFTRCGPFADYPDDPHSVFLTRLL